MNLSDLEKALRPLSARLMGVIRRGKVLATDDSAGVQRLKIQGDAGEPREQIDRVQQYGFTARPPEGSEYVMCSVGGTGDHLIAIAVDDRKTRPRDLAVGESAQWSAFGDRVWLRDGEIKIGTPEAADGVVRLSDLAAFVTAFNDLVAKHNALATAYASHAHLGVTTGPGTSGAPAGPPLDVTASTHSASASQKVKVDG